MVEQTPLAVIGGGNMGLAIVRGGIASGAIAASNIVVAEPDVAKHGALGSIGVQGVSMTAREAVDRLEAMESSASGAGQVLLAVKPQMLSAAAGEIGARIGERVVITIMAGTPGERVRATLGGACRVVRAMPNLPAKIGRGTTAVCLSAGAREGDDAFARRLFEGVGPFVATIDESMMDAFTAVAGSGPAYVFYLAEAMVRAAVELGFDERAATEIVRGTVAGAGALLGQSLESPAELRAAVTSKGGTTEAAVRVLGAEDLEGIVVRAIAAARDRGRELGG